MRLLFLSRDVFARSGEGFGGTNAPSGAMLGASSGNGDYGAAGAKSSQKSPSDYTCEISTKESQSLLLSSEIGEPKRDG